MKKYRIIPDINGTTAVWSLEKKRWNKWDRVYRHEDIIIVKKMKDHLLQRAVIYTMKTNIPETPLRTRPSTWLIKPKLKRLKIKRKDMPESLKTY